MATRRGKVGETAADILRCLKDRKAGLTTSQVADRLGIVPQTARYHLKRLAFEGKLSRNENRCWVRMPGVRVKAREE